MKSSKPTRRPGRGEELPPQSHQERPQPQPPLPPDTPLDDRERKLPDVDPADAPENPGDHAPVREPGDPPEKIIADERRFREAGKQSQQ
jgi:hypothetical protein